MGANPNYVLMNKDRPVLKFDLSESPYGEEIATETWRSETESLPIGYTNVRKWINYRRAPWNRPNMRNLLGACGCNTPEGYMQATHALSLSDTFWIREEKSGLAWKDVSLYRNGFDAAIAIAAFEGGPVRGESVGLTPEFSTDGSYAKCWERRNDGAVLLKRGSDLNSDREPYSEMYASQLAAIICRKSIPYRVERFRGKMVSSCPLFTDEQTGFMPIRHLFRSDYLREMLEYMGNYGAEDDFRRMIVLDALIVNVDRHRGNYGMLFDTDTMEIKGMAPVFDHNLSLFPELSDLSNALCCCFPKIGDDFNLTANSMLTPEIREDLKNLYGFTFSRNSRYNLPEERIAALEQIVNRQIDNILGRIRIPLYAHDYSGYDNIHRCDIDGRVEIAPTAKVEYSDILGNAKVLDFAIVDDSTVERNACVCQHASVYSSRISGDARIGGTVIASAGAFVCGDTVLDGDQVVGEDAYISESKDVYACGRADEEESPESSGKLPKRLTFYRNDYDGISYAYLQEDGRVKSGEAEEFLSVSDPILLADLQNCLVLAEKQILGEVLGTESDARDVENEDDGERYKKSKYYWC